MYRIVVLCLAITSGCASANVEAWMGSSSRAATECPDSIWDNGGGFRPLPGICKQGSGFLISVQIDCEGD